MLPPIFPLLQSIRFVRYFDWCSETLRFLAQTVREKYIWKLEFRFQNTFYLLFLFSFALNIYIYIYACSLVFLVWALWHGLDDTTYVRSLGVAIWPYLHPSISTALMRPRRPKQYCLQLVIYICIYLYILHMYVCMYVYLVLWLLKHYEKDKLHANPQKNLYLMYLIQFHVLEVHVQTVRPWVIVCIKWISCLHLSSSV